MTSFLRRSPGRKIRMIVGLALATWIATVAGIFGYERIILRASRDGLSFESRSAEPLLKFRMPGIARPPAVVAGASSLRLDEEVVGFIVGGRARAYRLDAFRDRSKHVVNDLIGGVPLTVTFCDISDCVAAYSGPGGRGPLEVSVGGLFEDRELVLEVGGDLYFQESGKPVSAGSSRSSIPLERLSPTRTTWGEWKRQYPSTEVYEGLR